MIMRFKVLIGLVVLVSTMMVGALVIDSHRKELKQELTITDMAPEDYNLEHKSLIFSNKDAKEVLTISCDGKVNWYGDQDKATLAFWDYVRSQFPKICDGIKGRNK